MRDDDLVYRTKTDDKKAEKAVRISYNKRMFFVWLALFIICYLVFAITGPSKEAVEAKFLTSLVNSTAKIVVETDYAGWEGTGVFIKDDLILTAGHVVDGAAAITVILADGSKYEAIDWYKENEADLGFIEVKTERKEDIVQFDDAVLGEAVWAIGNPFAVYPVVSKGIVCAVDMPDIYMYQKDMIIVDAAINPGNSGGPIYDTEGKILGICSWGFNGQGMSYFVRGKVCKLSLAKFLAIKALEEVK